MDDDILRIEEKNVFQSTFFWRHPVKRIKWFQVFFSLILMCLPCWIGVYFILVQKSLLHSFCWKRKELLKIENLVFFHSPPFFFWHFFTARALLTPVRPEILRIVRQGILSSYWKHTVCPQVTELHHDSRPPLNFKSWNCLT